MSTRQDFERSFELLIGHEGGFTDHRADLGNWTGGAVGVGVLKGTKFGISAASYPTLDIKNLTLADAHGIYLRDFWNRVGAPDMPPRLAFTVFDAGVNNGIGRAIRWLQTTVGSTADGVYGPNTRAAMERATRADETRVVVDFHAERLRFMVALNTWPTFGGGWSRRLARLPLEAAHYWPDPLLVQDTPAEPEPPVTIPEEPNLPSADKLDTIIAMVQDLSKRVERIEHDVLRGT